MKVPLSWLKEYVDFDLPPDELAARLTFSGTEVTGIATVGQNLDGVIVGEVLAVAPHPRAERLRVCRVGDGKAVRTVMCGAVNFEPGDRAAFAPPGVMLPGERRIEPVDIRGVVSEGMLCAEDELGLSDDHSGILVVSRDVPVGTPLATVLGLPDVVMDVEVTWNRSDCLSILGIAREVAALVGGSLRLPPVDFPEDSARPVHELTKVTIEDVAGCPRYTARVLAGVKLRPSPLWMRRRLALCGVRPINNVVDVTNYVMLECGQPLHAFDYELLEGREIVVRRVRPGERLVTLDGVARPVSSDMLVIADARRPVALAGIMGGAGSEIQETTKTVLLESAYFDPKLIHRTCLALGLTTESSYRFERGVDLGSVEWASRRASHLIARYAGAVAAAGVCEIFPHPPLPRRIECRFKRVGSLLGIDIPPEETVSVLNRLGLTIVARTEEKCTVEVPSFRRDLEIEADLIEEVARMHGLEHVPAAIPAVRINPDIDDVRYRDIAACRASLVGLGLTEIVNYSFVSSALLDGFCAQNKERRVVLPNPVSADFAVMRDSLLPQMVATLGRNFAYQTQTAALFEIGRVFFLDVTGRRHEEERVAVGLMGKAGRMGLDRRRPVEAEEMFLWVKGVIEALAAVRHGGPVVLQQADNAYCEPGWSVSIALDGRVCGLLGLVRDDIRRELRIPEPVGIAEMELEVLLGRRHIPKVQPVPIYPAVVRDVALVVDETVRHEEVLGIIKKSAPPELTAVELFDIFRGSAIGLGRKSLAYSLTYRSSERTLTDEEANRYHEAVKAALRSELKAEIREN
mgnify:CR=1 FL=1